MKLDVLNENNLEVRGTELESVDYTMADGQAELLFKILSQYSNPIGSIVREITTNGFDAHIEAGNTEDPVTVRINDDPFSEIAAFEVEDFGVGLTKERMQNVYPKFLASTKREGNEQHGAYGLGSKSPLSYTDMFYVTTFVDGVKYEYIVHKAKGVPSLNFVGEEPTDRENGTIISVPISKGDRKIFENEIKRQLAYFDNVIFENCGINNDYTIYEGDNYQYREDVFEKSHLILGKVYYPIDYNALSDGSYLSSTISRFKSLGIGLKFEIGELPVTWARENIEYTEGAKDLIKTRIKELQKELQGMHDKMFSSVTTVEEYMTALRKSSNRHLEIAPGVTINAHRFINRDPKYPKYKDIPIPTTFGSALSDFQVHRTIVRGLVDQGTKWNLSKLIRKVENNEAVAYYVEDKYSTKTNKYLHYKVLDDNTFYLVKKKPDSDLPSNSEYAKSYKSLSKQEADKIEEFRAEVEKYVASKLKSYNAITVPEDFTEELKKLEPKESSSRKKRETTKMPYRTLSKNNTWSGDFKFTEGYIDIDDVADFEGLIVYGHQDDWAELELVGWFLTHYDRLKEDYAGPYNSILDTNRAMILKISKSNARYFEDKPNFIHAKDLVNTPNNRIFRRIKTFHKVKHDRSNCTSHTWMDKVKMIFPELEDKVNAINSTMASINNTNLPDFSDPRVRRLRDEVWEQIDIYEDIIDACDTLYYAASFMPLVFKGFTATQIGEEYKPELQALRSVIVPVNSELLYKLHNKHEYKPPIDKWINTQN